MEERSQKEREAQGKLAEEGREEITKFNEDRAKRIEVAKEENDVVAWQNILKGVIRSKTSKRKQFIATCLREDIFANAFFNFFSAFLFEFLNFSRES